MFKVGYYLLLILFMASCQPYELTPPQAATTTPEPVPTTAPEVLAVSDIPSQSLQENKSKLLTFTITGSGTDFCSSTYLQFSSSDAALLSFSGITGTNASCTVKLTPGLNKQGTATLKLTLTQNGVSLEKSTSVTVGPAEELFKVDLTFGTAGEYVYNKVGWSYVADSVITADGNLVMLSNTWTGGSNFRTYVQKIDPVANVLNTGFSTDGEVNLTFGGLMDFPRRMLLEDSGKITSIHYSENNSGSYQINISRLLADGTPDPTFGGGDGFVDANICGPDCRASSIVKISNKYYVIGSNVHSDNMILFKLREDGGLDFMPIKYHDPSPGGHRIKGSKLLYDGAYLYALYHTDDQYEPANKEDFHLCKFDLGGNLITAFGTSGCLTILGNNTAKRTSGLAVLSSDNQSLFISGYRNDVPFITKVSTTTGVIDPGFGTAGFLTLASLGTIMELTVHPVHGLLAYAYFDNNGISTYSIDAFQESSGARWPETYRSQRFVGLENSTTHLYPQTMAIRGNNIFVTGYLDAPPYPLVIQKLEISE